MEFSFSSIKRQQITHIDKHSDKIDWLYTGIIFIFLFLEQGWLEQNFQRGNILWVTLFYAVQLS